MIERTTEAQRTSRTVYRVGTDAFTELRRHLDPGAARVPVLADPNVWRLYGEQMSAALAPALPLVVHIDGEAEKRFDVVQRVAHELTRHRVHRRETIVVLGGGVCCDVGGLVALLYMRGMRYAIVATSLMAQIDAAIGGKVGCNEAARKNLLGGFHHPDLVLIDPRFLSTLPGRHLRAALAEAVKLDLLLPDLGIDALLAAAAAGEQRALALLAERCLEGKLALLQSDPFETDLRRPLNLGHAIAHALEAMPGCELLHGEAVSVGLATTARYAELTGVCSSEHARAIVANLERLALPVSVSIGAEELRERLERIADHRGGEIHLTLSTGEGGTEIVEDCDFALLADCVHGVPVAG